MLSSERLLWDIVLNVLDMPRLENNQIFITSNEKFNYAYYFSQTQDIEQSIMEIDNKDAKILEEFTTALANLNSQKFCYYMDAIRADHFGIYIYIY